MDTNGRIERLATERDDWAQRARNAEDHNATLSHTLKESQKAGMAWMQRAVVAEDSADALAIELLKLRDLVLNSGAVNKNHPEFAAFNARLVMGHKTLSDYEKGRPK